jgi:adenine/guanine phosphoribosyltransferase-like PRPP-binding protein
MTTPAPVARHGSQLVTELLGIRLDVAAAGPDVAGPAAASYADAVELGLRNNPNRAQLLVSRLLGKHVPVPASAVLAAAHALGALVRAQCDGQSPVIIGFAETATGLGHGVAAVSSACGGPAWYLHTSRRPAAAGTQVIRFDEEHSHAVEQALALFDDTELRDGRPLVLVDDELTTGTTAVNAIRALQECWPRPRYILASLIDCRDETRRAEVAAAVRALGASVVSVSLLDGHVQLPADLLTRAAKLVAALPPPDPALSPPADARAPGARSPDVGPPGVLAPASRLSFTLPVGVPTTAMHGWSPAQELAAEREMRRLAASLPVARDDRTLVLGDEEFMYLPQLLAAALGEQVRVSTTTRTPAVTIDRPGYPLRTVLQFPATCDGQRPAFAYNVAASVHPEPGNAPGFDDIVLVTDGPSAQHAARLVAELARSARRSVHVVTVRSGPRSWPVRTGHAEPA